MPGRSPDGEPLDGIDHGRNTRIPCDFAGGERCFGMEAVDVYEPGLLNGWCI